MLLMPNLLITSIKRQIRRKDEIEDSKNEEVWVKYSGMV